MPHVPPRQLLRYHHHMYLGTLHTALPSYSTTATTSILTSNSQSTLFLIIVGIATDVRHSTTKLRREAADRHLTLEGTCNRSWVSMPAGKQPVVAQSTANWSLSSRRGCQAATSCSQSQAHSTAHLGTIRNRTTSAIIDLRRFIFAALQCAWDPGQGHSCSIPFRQDSSALPLGCDWDTSARI